MIIVVWIACAKFQHYMNADTVNSKFWQSDQATCEFEEGNLGSVILP